MLEKIQNRLNKEVEKIIEKKELSIPDYFYLEGLVSRLKIEQTSREMHVDTNNSIKMLFDTIKTFIEDKKCQCKTET